MMNLRMRRLELVLIISAIGCVTAAVLLSAFGAEYAETNPRLSDPIVEAPVTKQGTAAAWIELRNPFEETVDHIRFIPSCRCSVTKAATDIIRTGESSKAELYVNTEGRIGSFTVHVLIEYMIEGQRYGEVVEIRVLDKTISNDAGSMP